MAKKLDAERIEQDYLSHKTVKNRDVLPQWHWENNHPAIIKREDWNKTQEFLSEGRWNRKKPPKAFEKKFVVAKVKSGVLRGYFLLDTAWTSDERKQFLNIIKSINEMDEI